MASGSRPIDRVVEASRKGNVWSRSYGRPDGADDLRAWVRPKKAVARVEVKSTSTQFRDDSAKNHHWTASYEVVFNDGYTLASPIPKTDPGTQVEESVEDFVANLVGEL